MLEMIVRYESRWRGVSVLLAVLVFCGGTSCQRSGKAGKSAEVSSKESRKSEKDKESVFPPPVGEVGAKSRPMPSSDATENDCDGGLGDDIVGCLTSESPWYLGEASAEDWDKCRLAMRCSRLVVEYVMDLISRPYSEGAVVSLESFSRFLAQQGIELRIRKVKSPNLREQSGNISSPADSCSYTVDDIVGGPFKSPKTDVDNSDVLSIKFDMSVNGSELWALTQLLRAMQETRIADDSWCSAFRKYFDDFFVKHVRALHDGSYEFATNLKRACAKSYGAGWPKLDGGGKLYEYFVQYLSCRWSSDFRDAVKGMADVLFTINACFTKAGRMENSILTPFANHCRTVRLTRIFFVANGDNSMRLLGRIVRPDGNGEGEGGWVCYRPDDSESIFGRSVYGDPLGLSCSLFNDETIIVDFKDNKQFQEKFQGFMGSIYKGTDHNWDCEQGKEKYRLVIMSYGDCVDLFRNSVFPRFLEHFKEWTSKE